MRSIRVFVLLFVISASVPALIASAFLDSIALVLLCYVVSGMSGSLLMAAKRFKEYIRSGFIFAVCYNLVVALLLDGLSLDGQAKFGDLLGLAFIAGLPISLSVLLMGAIIGWVFRNNQSASLMRWGQIDR